MKIVQITFDCPDDETYLQVLGISKSFKDKLSGFAEVNIKEVESTPAEDWVKVDSGVLPDIDQPVLWICENGNYVVYELDKDGNPHLFEPMYFDQERPETYLGNIATHWRNLPSPPKK